MAGKGGTGGFPCGRKAPSLMPTGASPWSHFEVIPQKNEDAQGPSCSHLSGDPLRGPQNGPGMLGGQPEATSMVIPWGTPKRSHPQQTPAHFLG